MCLGIPGRIVSMEEFSATVDIAGTTREVSTMMLADEVSVGDYVLIHVGFAIAKMDEEEAAKTLEMILEYSDEIN